MKKEDATLPALRTHKGARCLQEIEKAGRDISFVAPPPQNPTQTTAERSSVISSYLCCFKPLMLSNLTEAIKNYYNFLSMTVSLTVYTNSKSGGRQHSARTFIYTHIEREREKERGGREGRNK